MNCVYVPETSHVNGLARLHGGAGNLAERKMGNETRDASGDAVPTMVPLVVAIAVTTFCCAPPLGIGAIVYAVKAQGAAERGERDVARRWSRTSMALSASGVVVGLLIELFLLVRVLGARFQ